MATVRLFLDTRRRLKDGTFPVKISVRHRGSFLVSTGFTATEGTWAGGSYAPKSPNAKARNAALRGMLSSAESLVLGLDMEGRLRSITDDALGRMIRDAIGRDGGEGKRGFISYLDEYVERLRKPGTRRNYVTTRNKLLAFDPECAPDTMDKRWLERFEAWMAGTMRVNAYAIHLRNIRAVFNYCVDEGYTTSYPFRKFRIRSEETRKRSLTLGQLRAFRDYPCEPYQERYRDMFMLMFYLIGINAVDLFLARPSALRGGRLEYKRAKTGKLYSVRVEPEAMGIIDRHRGKAYLLDVMETHGSYQDFLHRMNDALKRIGEVERKGRGGRKERRPLHPDISSYWARHTWATLAASLDIPSDTISEALGHEHGSKVTSIYIRYDRRKVDAANRAVLDALAGG